MLRVVFVDHTAKLSGGELALARLIPGIPGVEGLVILGEEGPFAQTLLHAGIRVEVLPLGAIGNLRKDTLGGGRAALQGALGSLRYVITLSRRLSEIQPDVVHTNSLKAGYLGCLAARLAGFPSVWHLRDRVSPDYLPPRVVFATRWAMRLLPDAVICNSHETARTARGNGDLNVIPSPVIHDPHTAPPFLRQDRGSRPVNIGLVGRLAPWKGQDLFLRAFAHAFPSPDPTTALLVGSAMFDEHDYVEELRTLIETLGLADRVQMVGFVNDVGGVLETIDVLVHASTIPEPFGQVVVEGMAAGLAVLAADTGGPAEIIRDDVDGILYPMGSEPALAAAMKRVCSDAELRARLGQAGIERAKDFAPEVAGASVRAVYDAVLSHRHWNLVARLEIARHLVDLRNAFRRRKASVVDSTTTPRRRATDW